MKNKCAQLLALSLVLLNSACARGDDQPEEKGNPYPQSGGPGIAPDTRPTMESGGVIYKVDGATAFRNLKVGDRDFTLNLPKSFDLCRLALDTHRRAFTGRSSKAFLPDRIVATATDYTMKESTESSEILLLPTAFEESTIKLSTYIRDNTVSPPIDTEGAKLALSCRYPSAWSIKSYAVKVNAEPLLKQNQICRGQNVLYRDRCQTELLSLGGVASYFDNDLNPVPNAQVIFAYDLSTTAVDDGVPDLTNSIFGPSPIPGLRVEYPGNTFGASERVTVRAVGLSVSDSATDVRDWGLPMIEALKRGNGGLLPDSIKGLGLFPVSTTAGLLFRDAEDIFKKNVYWTAALLTPWDSKTVAFAEADYPVSELMGRQTRDILQKALSNKTGFWLHFVWQEPNSSNFVLTSMQIQASGEMGRVYSAPLESLGALGLTVESLND